MFNPETGKRIHLTHGAGNGVDKACLMTASNMLIGKGEDGDKNSCVCPVMRKFIIRTNDAMPEELLGELYGPLAWEILGTATGDREIERQRACRLADWAIREIAPMALRAAGLDDSAAKLESLEAITDARTANAAARAARADRAARAADAAARASAYAFAYAAYAAANAAANAADAAARAADAADAADAAANAAARASAYAAANAADAAANAAANAADAAADAAELIWRKCPEIIREVSAIGDRRPVEPVIDHCALADALAN